MRLKANISPEMENICSVPIFETNLALEVSKPATTAASDKATTPASSTSIRKGTTTTTVAIRVSITTSFVGVWMQVALSVV